MVYVSCGNNQQGKNNNIDLKMPNHEDKIESELPSKNGKILSSSQSVSKDNTGRSLEQTLGSGNGEYKKLRMSKMPCLGFQYQNLRCMIENYLLLLCFLVSTLQLDWPWIAGWA